MEQVKVVMVQCRKTGEWYNPQEQFNLRMSAPAVIAMFKRLAAK
jgi:hypothetical protein